MLTILHELYMPQEWSIHNMNLFEKELGKRIQNIIAKLEMQEFNLQNTNSKWGLKDRPLWKTLWIRCCLRDDNNMNVCGFI
jgi:hypothetical protein